MLRTSEILPDHDDEDNGLDYREDAGMFFFPRCHSCGRVRWSKRSHRVRGKWYCEELCIPAVWRTMKVSRSAMWAIALLFVAPLALANELTPCHPMLPPGFPCQMPEIPPPGGILQAPPLSTCSATTIAGTPCLWPDVEVRPVEVVGISGANPNEPIYRQTALFLVPRPPIDVPLFVDVTVLSYQRNMQDSRFCGTGNEHRYYESAFWFATDNCPPVEE